MARVRSHERRQEQHVFPHHLRRDRQEGTLCLCVSSRMNGTPSLAMKVPLRSWKIPESLPDSEKQLFLTAQSYKPYRQNWGSAWWYQPEKQASKAEILPPSALRVPPNRHVPLKSALLPFAWNYPSKRRCGHAFVVLPNLPYTRAVHSISLFWIGRTAEMTSISAGLGSF